MDGVEDFDPSCWGLLPVRLATVGGLVLVDLRGEAPAVESHLGELAGHLERYRVGSLRRAGQVAYEVAANWKGIAENYNECLHCPGVHPGAQRAQPLPERRGPGRRRRLVRRLDDPARGRSDDGTGGHASAAPPIAGSPAEDLRSVLYFVLFPNALVSLHPDYVMLHTLWPRAADRTEVVCEWLFEPATIARRRLRPSDAVDFWDQVNREDWYVCELTAKGVRNRGYVAGRYSAEEVDVHAFDIDGGRALHGGAARAPGGAGMNEIAAKLGEVGLPEPVAALARRDWDAIVVGGGHNGLTAAAYLARAGRSVCVLERRERLGGACTLERPFSGQRFVVSPCAYVVGLLDDVVIRELELERRGLRYWMADPNLWVPFDDGTAFGQWLDDSRTQANLEELGVSAGDIEGYWAYEELFDEVRRKLRQGERDTWVGDAPTRAEIEELLDSDRTMIDLVYEASIAEVLDDHFCDERLKTALFGQGIYGTWGGPKDPGTASIKLMHFQGDMDGQGPLWGYVEGGMGMVSFAIADAARDAGAVLACGVPVAEIVPGEGVTLEERRFLRAGTVISNADPKRTLGLLDGQDVDPAFRERLERWKVRSPVVKFNAALERLPSWSAAPGEEWPARATIDVTGTIEEAQAAFEACERGEPAVGFGEIYVQTGYDPSPAPEGKHLMSVFGQYAPYELSEGSWDSRREEVARQFIDLIDRFAPGFEDCLAEYEVLGPPDIESRIGLTGGNIFQGEVTPDQMWEGRLTARTPVDGLYLCGAATHPAGSVIALNGRNAAAAVLADAGVALAPA